MILGTLDSRLLFWERQEMWVQTVNNWLGSGEPPGYSIFVEDSSQSMPAEGALDHPYCIELPDLHDINNKHGNSHSRPRYQQAKQEVSDISLVMLTSSSPWIPRNPGSIDACI